jgi:hypothetical protein
MIVTFPNWDSNIAYLRGELVVNASRIWQCVKTGGVGAEIPNDRQYNIWTNYVGPDTADLYSTTVTYFAGEFVYSGANVYLSIQNSNLNKALTDTAYWFSLAPLAWSSLTTYVIGNRVQQGGVWYRSIANANLNNAPPNNSFWISIPQTSLTLASLLYPIGISPSVNTPLRNFYRLPVGFVREAPQAPKQGSYLPLGAPAASAYSDWQYEGQYFTTVLPGPVVFRFAADIMNPDEFDPMFVDGFAYRVAFEISEAITQSTSKLNSLGGSYNKFMSEARVVNGIETGPTEAPEDTYITSRY